MKRSCIAIAVLCLAARSAAADVGSVEAFGLSVHLGASYDAAPRRLDADGVYVVNPGLGLAWDFRDDVSDSGFSPVVSAGWFQDCDDRAVYGALAGVRYRRVLASGVTLGGTLSVGVVNGEDWGSGERVTTIMPAPVLEIGSRIGADYLATLGVIYAPPNSAISATAGDGLLFFVATIGRSLL